MTMPPGVAGLEDEAWMREWVTRDTASSMYDRTQPNVEEYYKGVATASASPWEFAKDALFNILMGGWRSLTEFLGHLAGAIAGVVGGGLEDIADFMGGIVNAIADAFEWLGRVAGDIAEAVYNAFKKLAELLGLGGVWETAEDIIGDVGEFIFNIPKMVWAAFTKLADILGLDGVWETVEDIAGDIGDFIFNIPKLVWSAFEKIAEILNLDGVWETVEDIAGAVGGFIGKTWNWLTNLIGKLWNNAGDFIGDAVDIVLDGIHTLGDFFGSVADGLLGFASGAIGAVSSLINRLFNAAKSLFGMSQKAWDYAQTPRVFGSWQSDVSDDVSFASSLISGWVTPTAGQMVLIPITIHKTRKVEAVKIALQNHPPTMTNCYMGLYEVSRSADTGVVPAVPAGQATNLRWLGDVKPIIEKNFNQLKIIPLKGTALGVDFIEFPEKTLLYLAVVQTGTPTPMAVWADDNAGAMSSGTIPKSLGLAHSGSGFGSSFPASISDSQVVGKVKKYWGAVGLVEPQTGVEKRTLFDNFDRETVGADAVGPFWTDRSGGVNRPQVGYLLNLPDMEKGFLPKKAFATHANRLATRDQMVEASLWWPRGQSTDDDAAMRLALRGDGSGRFVVAWVAYLPSESKWRIEVFTCSGYSDDAPIRRSAADLPFANYPDLQNVFRFEARGSEYLVYIQRSGGVWFNVANARWQDGTFVFPVTDNSTEVGLRSDNSAIVTWTAKDL